MEEANFIKGVLNAVNPKDGTDYFIGGMDIDRNNGIQWLTGQPMSFTDFKERNSFQLYMYIRVRHFFFFNSYSEGIL